jgi:uncharacterized protein YbjQ (UPF0145 family)
MRASLFSWLFAVSFLFMASSVLAQSAAGAPPVRVFDAGELTPDRYTVVERIWTGTLRTLYWVPTHDDAGSAVTALTDKARSLGADAVVNLHCLNDGGYYCYGLAVKLK